METVAVAVKIAKTTETAATTVKAAADGISEGTLVHK
jgi:hypothetical protein